MRITLINPPQYTKYPQPPIGLALLGAWYENQGYKVFIRDFNCLQVNLESTMSETFGFTAMTTTIKDSLDIANKLYNMLEPTPEYIIGGVHATIFSKQIEQEYPWLEVYPGEFHALEDIENWPFLAYHLLPIDSYKPYPPHGKYGKWLPLITSVGCPYSCSYCSKAVFGNKYKSMSTDRVIEEIKYHQKRFGIKEITFYDDVFTLNKDRTYKLCEKILQSGLKFHWSCETRVNLVDKQMLKFMKEAGCYSIFYGLESGNQSILNKIHKGITLEQSENAIRLSHSLGLETVGYFMIGSPSESRETIEDTINFSKKLPLDYAQFAITTPLPGSELYEIWKQSNKDVDWSDFRYDGSKSSPVFEGFMLGRKDLEFYRSKAYRDFYIRPSYVWNKLVGLRNLSDFKVLFDGLNMLVKRS